MPAEPEANNPNTVLSQSEVEALLSQVSAGEPEAGTAAAAVTASSARPEPGPARYQFREPSFLTAGELRQLRLRHDEFVRSLVTRLSIYLRLEFGASLTRLDTLPFRRFADRLPQPTYLTLFKLNPLSGLGILEIPPDLGSAVLDRMLGGSGRCLNLKRDFSEIEVEVLDLFVPLVLKEWCVEVARQADAVPEVVAHESNPRYLQWSDPEAALLVASLRFRLGEANSEIRLAIPSAMLDPVIRQMNVGGPGRTLVTQPATATPRWHPQLDHVPVPVSAAWTGLKITARELAHLQVGDVLEVAPGQASQVRVSVSNIPKFVGRLGTQDNVWAVQLTGVL